MILTFVLLLLIFSPGNLGAFESVELSATISSIHKKTISTFYKDYYAFLGINYITPRALSCYICCSNKTMVAIDLNETSILK